MNFHQSELVAHKDIEVGGVIVRRVTLTIKSGEDLEAGSVLGQVTADGKWRQSVSASDDGSEAIRPAVLMHDCDATGGDVEAQAWIAGDFDPAMLKIGTGHDVDAVRNAWIGTTCFLPNVRHPDA